MPSKPPVVFPQEQRLLAALGERIRLARLRRKLSNAVVSLRAGISRTSLYKVERGDPGATLGSYLRVLAVLGLEGDLNTVAADDRVGRKLQDLALTAPPSLSPTRQRRARGMDQPGPERVAVPVSVPAAGHKAGPKAQPEDESETSPGMP